MLVLKYGISPEYVLDRMQSYEILALIKYGYMRNQENWELTRFMSYLIAQTNSTKKLKPTDIISFAWDKNEKDDEGMITKEDIERLTAKAEGYLKRSELR